MKTTYDFFHRNDFHKTNEKPAENKFEGTPLELPFLYFKAGFFKGILEAKAKYTAAGFKVGLLTGITISAFVIFLGLK